VLRGNSNTYIAEMRELRPPMIARSVRFVPVSSHPRTICMRVELFGCDSQGNHSHSSSSFLMLLLLLMMMMIAFAPSRQSVGLRLASATDFPGSERDRRGEVQMIQRFLAVTVKFPNSLASVPLYVEPRNIYDTLGQSMDSSTVYVPENGCSRPIAVESARWHFPCYRLRFYPHIHCSAAAVRMCWDEGSLID